MAEDIDKIQDDDEVEEDEDFGKETPKPIEKPWLFKKGNTFGKLGGRPKGPSMKVWLRNKLAEMEEDERQEFVKDLDKGFLFRMAEGNPKESFDVDQIVTDYDKLNPTEAIARAEELITKLRNRIGENGSNISDGRNSEVSKDGPSSSGSGTVLGGSEEGKKEGGDTAA